MAMAAHLQMVTDAEIEALEKDPASVNGVNKKESYSSYWSCSISYFLCGDAWPSSTKDRPLTAMFFGYHSVATSTLENGSFGFIRAGEIKPIAIELAKVDLTALKKQVEEADPEELADAEADDFELLLADYEDPGATICDDVKGLAAFFEKAARLGRGVIVYSS